MILMEKQKDKVRITIDLTGAMYERLNRVELSVGAASKADVVRDALRLYEFLVKKNADGYKFSMQREGETPERLVMFLTE